MERLDQIKAALATVRVPLFLAKESESRGSRRLTLHTAVRESAAALRKQADAALRDKGIAADCSVVVHSQSEFARSKSLEAFSAAFGNGTTVFDPTGAVGRAASVAACAASVRETLGARISGVFMDTGRRVLFVVLDRGRFADAAGAMLAERADAMSAIAATVTTWRQRADSLELAIRVGFELPANGMLIPVDRKSERFARTRRAMFERLRKPGIAATLASLLGLGGAAQAVAADMTLGSQVGTLSPEPAVAAPSLGLIAGGGSLTRNGTTQGWGAVGLEATIPLGDSAGAQFDAAAGGNNYYGFGGHIFMRDPSRGMLGVVASTESIAGDTTLSRVAVEGELYKDSFTLRGEVGAQSGTTANGAFGSVDLTFYPSDNLSLSAGGEFGSNSFGRASIEWQPALSGLPGLSLFADGSFGSSDSRVIAGVKYFFGTNGASLKDRDRRYDPNFSLFNTQSLGYNGGGYHAPV
jgi:hypothetical protein